MAGVHKYREQFERMKRWYEDFKKIDQGIPHTLSSEHYQDVVYAYFQNCYHLKDWIKNDDTIAISREKIEDFINQNSCMQTCADLCNGTKHLKLRNERSGDNPQFGPRHYTLILGGEPIIKVKWVITTKTGDLDAFQLASECVQKWDEFIRQNL